MLKRIQPINVTKNTNLHVIKSDKFKTNLIGIYIQRPLLLEEATKNTLISMILQRATEKSPSFKEINNRLEDLYGGIILSDVVKKGEKQILQIKMQLPNSKYVNDTTILDKGLKLLNEVLNYPYIENQGFSEEYFEQEKENLKEKIKSRINDKMKFAVDRCVEEMCKNEKFSVYEYGDLVELEKINRYSLYEHYKRILNKSLIDIFLVGDVDENNAYDLISKNISIHNDEPEKIPREIINKEITNIKTVEDNFNINQGKLTLGYRTNIPYESELYEASVLYSNILGGGPNSKLFKNVREKESLCYYIFSKIEKFKSIMLVSSGIEFKNFNKAKDLINQQFEQLNKGNFDNDDIVIAKKSILTSIKSLTDAPNMLMDFYYSQVLSDVKDDIDIIMEKINSVDKNLIIKAGKSIELDTIYFLNKLKEEK